MIDCIDTSLICYAEHGFAASTFAARVTASTLSDAYSAICSGIGTLRGGLHGGANEKAFELISSFDSVEIAQQGMAERLERKEIVMGFGHRIYKNGDPRSDIMRAWAEELAADEYGAFARSDLMEVANVIEEVMMRKKGM